MFRLGRLSVVLVLLTTILIASLSSAAPIDESSDKPQERPGSQPQSPASDSWTRDSVKRLARQIQDEANREWDACMARYVEALERSQPTTDITPAMVEKHRQMLQSFKTICSREVYRLKEKVPETQWMKDWDLRRQQPQQQQQAPPSTSREQSPASDSGLGPGPGLGGTSSNGNGRTQFGGGGGGNGNGNGESFNFELFSKQVLDSMSRYTFGGENNGGGGGGEGQRDGGWFRGIGGGGSRGRGGERAPFRGFRRPGI